MVLFINQFTNLLANKGFRPMSAKVSQPSFGAKGISTAPTSKLTSYRKGSNKPNYNSSTQDFSEMGASSAGNFLHNIEIQSNVAN